MSESVDLESCLAVAVCGCTERDRSHRMKEKDNGDDNGPTIECIGESRPICSTASRAESPKIAAGLSGLSLSPTVPPEPLHRLASTYPSDSFSRGVHLLRTEPSSQSRPPASAEERT